MDADKQVDVVGNALEEMRRHQVSGQSVADAIDQLVKARLEEATAGKATAKRSRKGGDD